MEKVTIVEALPDYRLFDIGGRERGTVPREADGSTRQPESQGVSARMGR